MADIPATAPALLALRERIDALDRDLLALLNRRATLALEVGEIKKGEGSVVFRPEREAQVIDGLKAINTGPLQTTSVAPIWREIHHPRALRQHRRSHARHHIRCGRLRRGAG